MHNKYLGLAIVFLMITCLAAFGRIAENDFISYDDNLYITENPHIQSGFNTESIQWAFTAIVVSNWHPLTLLSHMLDWQLFGANASGHHLVNLLLHIGAVILLFLFLYKTTNNLWPSAFAAAFFALHPLRVESVAWAAERKDVLSMFFAMATLYTYAFYVENRKTSKYLLCLFLFALALMSKPMMVTLPFVLLLLDYWPLKRWEMVFASPAERRLNLTGRVILEKIPFIFLTIASCFITFRAQNKSGALVQAEMIPFMERFSNAIVSYLSYLAKTFWPVNLAVFYPFVHSLPLWKVFISTVILLFITAVALYFSRKLPFLLTGWFLYLGTLVPVIGLVQVGDQAMADRYTYLPSIGIFIILVWGIYTLFNKEFFRKFFLFPVAMVILIVLAILTYRQCGYWKNSIVLYHYALSVTEKNYKIHHNMGATLFKKGKIREAEHHFDRAVNINPNYLSFNSRGEIHARAGKYQQAFEDFNQAISLNPRRPDGYYNRGLTYEVTGQFLPALADFNKAISLDSNHVNSYNNRGIVYARLNRTQEAIEDFTKIISIKPDDGRAYANRAIAYFSQGKNERGCRDAKKARDLGSRGAAEYAEKKALCH